MFYIFYRYIHPLPLNGELQSLKPEFRGVTSRTSVVREQIYALNSISNRLRSAFDGHGVEWIDPEETWSSGSGSGDSSLDSVTDDEDGLTEDGSGYEKTLKPIKSSDENLIKSKDHTLNSSVSESLAEVDSNENMLDKKSNFNVNISSNNFDRPNITHVSTNVATLITFENTSFKIILVFLLAIATVS